MAERLEETPHEGGLRMSSKHKKKILNTTSHQGNAS